MQMCSCNETVEVFWAFLCLISRLWTRHLQIRNTPTVLWASAAAWLLCLSACPCYSTTNYNSLLMPILLSFQCCLSKVCGPAPSHHCHLLLTAHCNACFLFALQLTKFRETRKRNRLPCVAPLQLDTLSPKQERKHLLVSEGGKLLFFTRIILDLFLC